MFVSNSERVLKWVAAAAILWVANIAHSEPGPLIESWSAYTNGVPPYGDWIVDRGSWGEISDKGMHGDKCCWIAAGARCRMIHPIDVASDKDIVLQAWFYDSGGEINRSVLGLTDRPGMSDSLIRIGIGTPKFSTYTVVFFDKLQATNALIRDTGLEVEKGWHFMRLEIMHDRTVTYRIWNASQTEERKGTLGWVFDKARFKYVVIGSIFPSPGAVGWGEIKVGSLEQVGPPPHMGETPKESSQ